MQRTVSSIKFTYANVTIDENGTPKAELATHNVFNETDENKALKKAIKDIGYFKPIKTEKTTALYFLDDDIFFRYAVKVEDKG